MAVTFTQTANWFTSGAAAATVVATWAAGDEIFVFGATEGGDTTLGTPTATGLTFSLVTSIVGTNSESTAYLWRATAGGSGSGVTISAARGGSNGIQMAGLAAWVVGGGVSAVTALTGDNAESGYSSVSAPSGGMVIVALSDWNATNGGSGPGVVAPIPKTPATGTGTATERFDTGNGSNYAVWGADWQGTTTSSATYGPNNYTSLKVAKVGAVITLAGGTTYTPTPADAVGVTDSASDVVAGVRTPADPVGVTDSAAPTVAAVRGPADPVGATDQVAADTGRLAADVVGVTDSAATVATVDRGAADPVGVTDSAGALQSLAHTAADPVGVTDSATTELGQVHTPADPVGVADSVLAEVSAARSAADVVGVTDSAAPELTSAGGDPAVLGTFARSSADPHSITIPGATAGRDIWLLVNTAAVVTTPSGWTLTTSRVATMASYVYLLPGTSNPGGDIGVTLDLTAARALSAVAIQASAAATGTVYASLLQPTSTDGGLLWGTRAHTFDAKDDTFAVYFFHMPGSVGSVPSFTADNYDTSFTAFADTGWAGTGTSGDEGTRVMVGYRQDVGFTAGGVTLTLAGASGPYGSAVGFLAFDLDPGPGMVADSVGVTDSAATVATVDRTLADPLGVADTVAQLVDVVSTTADTVASADAVTLQQATSRAPADAVGVTDSASADLVAGSTDYTKSPADPVGVTDVAATAVAYVRTVADLVGVTDTDSPQTIDIGYDLADPAGVTDTAATVAAVVRAPADTVGVTDTASAALDGSGTIVRTLDDAVGVTDTVAPAVAAIRTAADAVGVADAVALAVTRSPADPVGVTDSVARLAALGRQVDDTVGVADTVTVARLTVVTVADAVGVTDEASNAGDSPWFVWRGGALVRHRALLGGVHLTTVDVT